MLPEYAGVIRHLLKGTMMDKPRELRVIASEIRETWPKVHYTAEPYLRAMERLSGVNDRYYEDDGKSVVLYFLSNASMWRGEAARRIKAELRGMVSS